ncbi:TPA: NmrA/HSCARG family protein [Klebsiella aerogenes]|uniref:NmrA/HSCARG family protein n=1 Tax=Klebsiella aerogenes TaxID=548 RepID=UPI0007B38473|nr:NmrA/HSCARG family protein [Klebsiella aerogenes]ELA1690644.1 NmrA/HSCARG family protein [Klebsiella aerogenes]ELW9545679.1 NmrA/HSCARG family protein [Klebsiella aerogenes]KZR19189.1 NmrA family protein [Klebsiella aerogenes]MDT4309514.1 NmrA/HSCARG family protein [Klebsiella aerogenes]PLC38604.1 NmrA/HSCARG family protein [Klebsiella aerogenes]
MNNSSLILVFGATGQQGGSVARALINKGWPVRVMVRNPSSPASLALRDAGAELVAGNFDDIEVMRGAMTGAYGVFSVQPSSPGGTVTDDDEVRYGKTIASLASECGVQHLVYSSGGAVSDRPTGVAHFDTKAEIERHIHTLPIVSTIVRPATFMELLVMPGFGLDEGQFHFFMQPDGAMQVLAVEDIGKIVAAIYAQPERFKGKTFEIASDVVTGLQLQELFSAAAGRLITYSRFSDAVLTANPFLQKLTALADDGRLVGHASLEEMRQLNPQLQSFESWLAGNGRDAFERALAFSAKWEFNR